MAGETSSAIHLRPPGFISLAPLGSFVYIQSTSTSRVIGKGNVHMKYASSFSGRFNLGRESSSHKCSHKERVALMGLFNIQGYRNVVYYISTGRSHYYRVVVLDQIDAATTASHHSSH